MGYEFFTVESADRFTFYRIPKALITDDQFHGLGVDAAVAYGLLLDRVSLSRENGWVDEQSRVYVYYPVQKLAEDMNCGKEKACKLLAKLKQFKLLESKAQGQGKPSMLYPKTFW